LIKDTNALMS